MAFRWILLPVLLLVGGPSQAADQIYTYKDDAGTPTFTTEWESIPEQYKSRAIPLNADASSPVSSGTVSTTQSAVREIAASGEYRMGDHDTRSDAIRLAVELAKRQALEQVATYLESVTEVTNADITRDDIRTYTAGVVTVLDQTISTRLEGQTVVIRADLKAQVDENEVRNAILALRENESAKHELEALRTETDQLQQQLAAANQALSSAVSPDQVQALTQERQQMLNQLQADALVSQAWTDWVYVTPIVYPYPSVGVQQVHALLLQARQLHPTNRHLQVAQEVVTRGTGTLPAPSSRVTESGHPPRPSLWAPPPIPPQSLPVPGVSPLANANGLGSNRQSIRLAPEPVRPPVESVPLAPTLHQVHPPHPAQPNPPVLRAPFSSSFPSEHFGRGGGHPGGGGHHGR